jgi:predicted GNAT family acetyltransferase
MTAMPEPTTAPLDVVVEDNPEEARYEARIGDRIVGIAEYELTDEQGPIVFVHTEVVPDVEGQGVGARLARSALEDVRRRGLRLVSDCPFISAFLKRHHDWDDLIVEGPAAP